MMPDHRLVVFFCVSGSNSSGKSISENRLLEILPDGSTSSSVPVPLKGLFTDLFPRTVRAASSTVKDADTARHTARLSRHDQLRPHSH
jgi:hypothetical protein